MGYGSRLKYEGLQGRTPPGRYCWKGALNQVKGILKWGLTFLEPEEILDLLTEVRRRELRSHHFEEMEHRLEYFQYLKQYHEDQAAVAGAEIERTESVMTRS